MNLDIRYIQPIKKARKQLNGLWEIAIGDAGLQFAIGIHRITIKKLREEGVLPPSCYKRRPGGQPIYNVNKALAALETILKEQHPDKI
jgi:hypothetical protein